MILDGRDPLGHQTGETVIVDKVWKGLGSGGQLRLVAPDKQLRALFKLTCTDTILIIDPDRAAALAG